MRDASLDARLGGCSLAANLVERAASVDSNSSVRARSTCRRRGGRAAAAPPFSGPRSRAAVAACVGQPQQHRCALQPWGATANGACARGHHHRPDSSGVVCHAFACPPGAGAGGLGYGRRHHSRWPRPAQEQTVLMARRRRTENGAPRAWAGERTPGHLPLLHACARPAANLGNWRPKTGLRDHLRQQDGGRSGQTRDRACGPRHGRHLGRGRGAKARRPVAGARGIGAPAWPPRACH